MFYFAYKSGDNSIINDDEKRIIFKTENFHPKLIAHECFHVTHHIMDEIGEEFNINSHESFAWLNEYLFNFQAERRV